MADPDRQQRKSLTRRRFVSNAAYAAMAALVARPGIRPPFRVVAAPNDRFRARPVADPRDFFTPGQHTLSSENGRDTVLYLPASAPAGKPAPLILGFHGATMDMSELLDAMRDAADRAGIILLLPSSAGRSWDAIRGQYGVDLAHADEALDTAFRHCAIDPRHIAIAGFSDGGSYAVSLGLTNGDLFTHIIALSAGFVIPGERHGRPQAFIAHGTYDRILPIDQCGRRIAQDLEAEGYPVQFVEFAGRHEIVPSIVDRATTWFTS